LLGIEEVPTFNIHAFPAQFGKAADTPNISGNAPILFEEFGCGYHFAQNHAAPQTLYLGTFSLGLAKAVHARQDILLDSLGHSRMAVVLIHQGDVIEDIFLILNHTTQTLLNDDRKFIGKGRIVGNTVRYGRGEDMAVPILML